MSDSVSEAAANLAVAFLGPTGTFSHEAASRCAGETMSLQPVASIDDVFLAVEAGNAELGVVPVENSTEGAVNTTQDCLVETSLRTIAELYLPIQHNFLVNPVAEPGQIRRIVSHKQSLGQCRLWLREHFPAIECQDVASNAEAARMAASDPDTAAIAGELAASTYQLKILHAGIQDRKNNTTRFLVLSRDGKTSSTGCDKTSILVYAENKPGALFRILAPFDKYQVSLTRIETRPARDGVWSYVFFIDFEGHMDDPAVRQVFSELTQCTVKIKNLGSYPRAIG
ncbi:hypothetical protein GCM10011403_02390 [Pseudohongiella nitratireducens]|uniref:Prephenate dehydratase n=1 Tax=Pseudohongiella nitratireducens TaxID=1768907 RepID=A0A917GJL0_9GAMM|nr:prephenate dehydratase [Pseudohongiella nitratireducens]MDF1623757.1 prephenate dehydratase [Pseudohongiella nitratireducens]GGG48836.1 hypothetical protein GCM10011403_02390 [Pseudohongiella nitratireducens]